MKMQIILQKIGFMKSSSLVQIYKDFLNGKCTITPNVMSMKETLIKSPSSLFFIFETIKNRFNHEVDSTVTVEELTTVIELVCTFDSALLRLIEEHKKSKLSDNSDLSVIEKISTSLVSNFRKHISNIYINRPILDKIISRLIDSQDPEINFKDDLLFGFYGHLITKHSLYGMVYWMHNNPGKPFNWRRACREFMILNKLDPSREEELLENFSSAVNCLVKETKVCEWTHTLSKNEKHYFTSDLNSRMLQLLAVDKSGAQK